MAKLYSEFVKELALVPKKQRRKYLKKFFQPKKHLHIFGKFFFSHIIKGDFETPECHINLIEKLSSPKDAGIIFPRGFAKTTWEKIDTIHDIVYKYEPVIVYVGNTLQDAKFHFESIKTELENNLKLHKIYGDLVPSLSLLSRKWTNIHFETTNGVNVIARGAGKGRGVNIKNQRPTKIILDDIEDDEQVKSPDRRMKLHKWIYDVIYNSKDAERGRIKFIGTVISPMVEVLKFYKAHGGIFRKAIENGQSIWPERFSVDKLYRIRDGYVDEDNHFVKGIGTRSFSQEYLNSPVNEDEAMIKPVWIEKSYYSVLNTKGLVKIVMMDPQSGESRMSDYYGIAVIGFYPKDRHRYLMQIKTGKASQIEQAAQLVRTWQEDPEHVRVVGVEKILGQVAVYQIILEWKAGRIELPGVDNKNRNMPFKSVEPQGKDKIARLQIHEPAIERGEVHLHQSMTAFGEKLVAFPEIEHDDDIDAFIYALDESFKSGLSLEDKSSYNTKGNSLSNTIVGNIENQEF